MTVIGNGEGTLSRVSSQLSLPTVPEDQQQPQPQNDHWSSKTSTPPTPQHDTGMLTINSNGNYRLAYSDFLFRFHTAILPHS